MKQCPTIIGGQHKSNHNTYMTRPVTPNHHSLQKRLFILRGDDNDNMWAVNDYFRFMITYPGSTPVVAAGRLCKYNHAEHVYRDILATILHVTYNYYSCNMIFRI